MTRALLHIDQAYSLRDADRRGQLQFITSRNRNGFFSKVISVHPLMGVLGNHWATKFDCQQLTSDHQVIDGFLAGRRIPFLLVVLNVIQTQIRIILWMRDTVRRHDIDLIYAADCFYTGFLGAVVKKLTGRPLMIGIMANHDLAYETTGVIAYPRLLRFRRVEQWLQRRVLAAADWIEIAAEDSAQYVQRYGAEPAKFVRLPVVKFIEPRHLVPPSDRGPPGPALSQLGIPADKPMLICLGRLRPVKYSLDAFDAMRIALEKAPEAIAIFAGDGELRGEIETRIKAYGLTGRIFLPGNIDQAALSAILPGCIALSPLTGMALIETSLAGAPPIVYDVEWQPEFVTNGTNGFVVPFRDSGAMGRAALRLIQEPDLRERLSAAARDRALRFADPQAYAHAEQTAFQRILGPEKRGRELCPS